MTQTTSDRAAARSRRRFLKLVAMGSVAMVAAPAAAATSRRARPARPAAAPPAEKPSALEAEIAKQKKSTADLLKTIRDYQLPPGSEMAFAFAPTRAAKRRVAAHGGAR